MRRGGARHGPGGEEVGRPLAEAGLDVVGVEGELLGGECPYWGCVPSKMMIRAANLLAEARRDPGHGRGVDGRPRTGRRWRGASATRPPTTGTTRWRSTVRGQGRPLRARLGPPRRAAARGGGRRRLRGGRAVVLATGARPWAPPIPGLAGTTVLDQPRGHRGRGGARRRWWCSGAAPSASSSARSSPASGAEVTVVEAAPPPRGARSPSPRALLADVLAARGHRGAHRGAHHRGRTTATAGFVLELDGARARRRPSGCSSPRAAAPTWPRSASRPSASTRRPGRSPSTGTCGCTDGVWAIGDVTGMGPSPTSRCTRPTSCVEDILGHDRRRADYRALPRVTFTDPEIGSVGLSEAAAARAGGSTVRTVGTPDAGTRRGAGSTRPGNEGFIKLVEDAGRGVLVGATSAGPDRRRGAGHAHPGRARRGPGAARCGG